MVMKLSKLQGMPPLENNHERLARGFNPRHVAVFDMRFLLEQAGFRIRGATRAECTHCQGRSRGTVAFTDKVAYCHRCKWTANVRTLARELGLLPTDPESQRRFRQEQCERRQRERIASQFESWRNNKLNALITRHCTFFQGTRFATEVLRTDPNCDPAWDALKRYYDNEAKLMQQIDWLSCTKASLWLEVDSKITDVFAAWRQRQAAA
jgi:hypothetical protein